jgi:hypothetical protein
MDDAAAPPDDLVELKARWYELKDVCDRIATEEPAGDYLKGSYETRLFSDEQNDRLAAARASLRELTLEIAHHPWKARQSDRHAAERVLNETAHRRAAEHAAERANGIGS